MTSGFQDPLQPTLLIKRAYTTNKSDVGLEVSPNCPRLYRCASTKEKNMAHEDIMIAIQDLDRTLNCISFDKPTTKLIEQTNQNLNQIALTLNSINETLRQTFDLGSKK